MYTATTRNITVKVQPQFLAEQSDPVSDQYVWLYTINIENGGTEAVQLLNRHWIITNAYGVEQHVRGPGVVGHQPLLREGESFHYTSGCPMDTSVGSMHGTYQMVTEEGSAFDAEVAPFTLAEPYALN